MHLQRSKTQQWSSSVGILLPFVKVPEYRFEGSIPFARSNLTKLDDHNRILGSTGKRGFHFSKLKLRHMPEIWNFDSLISRQNPNYYR